MAWIEAALAHLPPSLMLWRSCHAVIGSGFALLPEQLPALGDQRSAKLIQLP